MLITYENGDLVKKSVLDSLMLSGPVSRSQGEVVIPNGWGEVFHIPSDEVGMDLTFPACLW